MYLYNSRRNPRQISVGPSFYCALNCFSPLVTAVGPTPNAPIKTTATVKIDIFFPLLYVAARRALVRLSRSSLSSPSLSARTPRCVLSRHSSSHFLSTLATAADVLPLCKLSLSSLAAFYFLECGLRWVLLWT